MHVLTILFLVYISWEDQPRRGLYLLLPVEIQIITARRPPSSPGGPPSLSPAHPTPGERKLSPPSYIKLHLLGRRIRVYSLLRSVPLLKGTYNIFILNDIEYPVPRGGLDGKGLFSHAFRKACFRLFENSFPLQHAGDRVTGSPRQQRMWSTTLIPRHFPYPFFFFFFFEEIRRGGGSKGVRVVELSNVKLLYFIKWGINFILNSYIR